MPDRDFNPYQSNKPKYSDLKETPIIGVVKYCRQGALNKAAQIISYQNRLMIYTATTELSTGYLSFKRL